MSRPTVHDTYDAARDPANSRPPQVPSPAQRWRATYRWTQFGNDRVFYFATRAEREAWIDLWERELPRGFKRSANYRGPATSTNATLPASAVSTEGGAA